MIATREHKGWYCPRGLPHFDSPELPQFITFHLYDSLPASVVQARCNEASPAYRRRIQAALDAGHGACRLKRADLAEIVCESLFHGCGRAHEMHAFVVMPNHVHALATFCNGSRLCDILQRWKSYSARRINERLGRAGTLWQRDYFDRYIRDEKHFETARAYIENNPVITGLVKDAKTWPFSSASNWSVDLQVDV